MSSRKKFLLVFGFIVLNMFMLVSFLVIRDATMENELKNEMEYLSKIDIIKKQLLEESMLLLRSLLRNIWMIII